MIDVWLLFDRLSISYSGQDARALSIFGPSSGLDRQMLTLQRYDYSAERMNPDIEFRPIEGDARPI
jgi:hypothetical protein